MSNVHMNQGNIPLNCEREPERVGNTLVMLEKLYTV